MKIHKAHAPYIIYGFVILVLATLVVLNNTVWRAENERSWKLTESTS